MKRRRSRLSIEQADALLACFVAGTPARPAAEIAEVNRNTARLYYHRLRETIASHLEADAPLGGQIEASDLDTKDPSLLPRSPEVARVVPLFGLVERAGRVHVVLITGATPAAQPAAQPPGSLKLEAVVCADEAPPEAAARPRRLRIVLRRDVVSDPLRRQAVRGFWHMTLRHLRRFNGVPRQHLFLYLKECEWRFNGDSNEQLLRTLKSWALETS